MQYSDEELLNAYPNFYQTPQIHETALVMPGAHVLGDVQVGAYSSIWHNAVVRGDVNYIRIGERTNIQDLTMVHVSYQTHPAILGDDVVVGHSAIIHACEIGNRVLVGMGTTILDGAKIPDDVLIGAGSLITENKTFPSGSKIFGRPARVVGELTQADRDEILRLSAHYVRLAQCYKPG